MKLATRRAEGAAFTGVVNTKKIKQLNTDSCLIEVYIQIGAHRSTSFSVNGA